MRWLTFVILAILAVTLQATVAGRVAWFGARPDWILVLVVFYALHTRTDEALVAGWVAGALADLMTIERFGLLAVSYGLASVAVYHARDWMFTGHPLTQFSVTLVVAAVVQGAWMVYRTALGMPAGSVPVALASCLHTALWAPVVHWALLKVPRLLRVEAPRRHRHSVGRTGGGRV
jgi:rod shape-determining protein MreD